jgi:hypothetical protein
MDGLPDATQIRFANNLYATALYVQMQQDHLDLDRKAKGEIRRARVRAGRARAAIENSLDCLEKAKAIGRDMVENDGLRPGSLNFEPSKKALERIKKTIIDLEAMTAALIHPGLRTGEEERLAEKTPRKLNHPPFKATPGSEELMHRAVEMLDDDVQNFTDGRVPTGRVNRFISEFLETFFGWTVHVKNVKTIRARYRESKQSAGTPRSS